MQRALLTWVTVGLLAFLTGCAVCSAPYDYCGPTFTGGDCGGNCDPRLRSGSILAPADMPVGPGEMSDGPVITQEMVPGQMMGPGQQIIEEGTPVQKETPGPTPAKPSDRTTRNMSRLQR